MREFLRKVWAVISAVSALQWAVVTAVAAVPFLGTVALRVLGLGTGWAIVAAIGLLLLLTSFLLLVIPRVRRWFGPHIDMGRFADDCERLSRQIHELLAEQTAGIPTRLITAPTEQGRRRQMAAITAAHAQQYTQVMAKYQEKFVGPAFALWHEANVAGLVGENEFRAERASFEHVTNRFNMDEVARILAVLALRARQKAQR